MPKEEKLWLYDAVEPGQAGEPTVVQLTAANITEYAQVTQNPDSRFRLPPGGDTDPAPLMAMPTMVLSYAPLLREDIARANGFVAQEASPTHRRQTPFAKCEIRWRRVVQEFDVITATRRVLEKYERRGSRFVTFRVEAANQRGEPVADYDYTCIFDYVQGQKEVPQDQGSGDPDLRPPETPHPTGRLLTFDTSTEGEQLATLALAESQTVINAKDAFRLAGEHNPVNIHTDEEFARQNIFRGTVSSGPAAMAYVDQMLARSIPLRSFHLGGRLLTRAIEPFRAGDTVTWQGEVTDKRVEDGNKMVEFRIRGTNQRGALVNLSDASFILP